MEKEPTVSNKTVFKDVKDNMWYYSAILWAYENKIVKGIGTDIFAPDKGITRKELVNIMGLPERAVQVSGDITEVHGGQRVQRTGTGTGRREADSH